jgi:hypothetical protein
VTIPAELSLDVMTSLMGITRNHILDSSSENMAVMW